MTHLVTTRFPWPHFTIQRLECFGEERPDKVRLQLARLCLFHFLFHCIEVLQGHVMLDQRIAFEDFLEVIGVQCTIDNLIEFGLNLRGFAVANGLDQ